MGITTEIRKIKKDVQKAIEAKDPNYDIYALNTLKETEKALYVEIATKDYAENADADIPSISVWIAKSLINSPVIPGQPLDLAGWKQTELMMQFILITFAQMQ